MIALVTGASSGLGKDFSILLSNMGYDIIAVARDKENLELLKDKIKTDLQIIPMDLSEEKNCYELYEQIKSQNIDILINNAGFGAFGKFDKIDIDKELNMIDVNIKAVHILTKMFLKDFKIRNSGYILNVASSAAFEPGPLMAAYYASKAYVLRLTEAIYEELRKDNSQVKVSCLCPGPVETNFNEVAGVKFSVKPLQSHDVVKYAIANMFKGKLVIVPGIIMKLSRFGAKLLPEKLTARIAYKIQKSKEK